MGERIPAGKEQPSSGKNVYELLERAGFLKMLASPEDFKKWVDNLSYDEFKSHLIRLNGILRNTPITQRSIDGVGAIGMSMPGVEDVAYIPPRPEDRDMLLGQVFESLKQVPDAKDKALLLYYTIQAIHPFSDGNGRTGRLLYTLLSGEVNKERLSTLLDHEEEGHRGVGKGRDTFAKDVQRPEKAYYYLHRELAKKMLGADFFAEYGAIYVNVVGTGRLSKDTENELGEETARQVRQILTEGNVQSFSMGDLTMVQLMQEYPELKGYTYTNDLTLDDSYDWVVEEDYGKKTYAIKGEDLMEALTPEQAKRALEIHRELKQKLIAVMIDVFVHPQAHKAKKGEDLRPIKEFFRK